MSDIIQRIFRLERSARFRSLLGILALAAMPLSADTIASTLSTAIPPFDPGTGDSWAVGLSNNIELAVGFQDPSASLSYLLTQIQVADGFALSDPNSSTNPALNDLIVGLWQSTTSDPDSATEIQSWDITAPGSTGNPQLYTLTSAVPTVINPTGFYFITESVTFDGANTAEWGWQENNLTPMQIGYYTGTPASLSFANNPCTEPGPCTAANDPDASGTPAFSVSGTAVTATPEPRSYAVLLGAGLLSLLILKNRAQRRRSDVA